MAFLALTAATAVFPFATGAEPSFDRDIRPILSDRCFSCHGPDANQRKADLRLDSFEAATANDAIVPGDLSASKLVKRITSTDPGFMMPPPESGRVLSPAEIERLKTWIAQGAEYEPHWSFEPVRDVSAPHVEELSGWARTDIDAFVLARLREEGVEPSPEADKETLLRRVTLDLTGLPPTLEEIDAFLGDESASAYEKVVDRLLRSPAYGERMALDWLDLARYADTYGYQNDRESRVWPYRDWVIKAFNDNLPYDEFITQQIAGDLLPNTAQGQVVATAFNRLHRQTNEGGSILEEWRTEYVADRVHTLGTAFLGMTLECARCHDHKFDPVSQADYYSLFAFFNTIDESGMYSHYADAVPSPSRNLYTPESRQKHRELKAEIQDRETVLADVRTIARGRFESWLTDPQRSMPVPPPVAHVSFDELVEGVYPNDADAHAAFSQPGNPEPVLGVEGNAVKFSGENAVESDAVPLFDRSDAFTIAAWIKPPEPQPHVVIWHRTKAREDAGNRGYDLTLKHNRPQFTLAHFWPGNALAVRAHYALPAHTWSHVTVSYNGSSEASGVRIYVNGERVPTTVVRDHLTRTARYGTDDEPAFRIGSRSRDVGFKNGVVDELRVYDVALTAPEAKSVAITQPLRTVFGDRADSAQQLNADGFEYYLRRVDRPYRSALQSLREARRAEADHVESVPAIMVMREMAEPRQAHVLARGAYDRPTEPVTPDTPDTILPFPDDVPKDRLGLAQWLTDARNPLTARVAVNRMWNRFFGRGFVKTLEDFGAQGHRPSHPDLLDYLATRFVESGWDTKALQKNIVMSAVYRQNSTPRPELVERDPENVLLARGPRHRLKAEVIRDSALAASGLLADTVGGPSVKPYQPEGLWEDASSTEYHRGSGDDLYRRSLYTFIKRTVPPPAMITFDALPREVCTARREVTVTPLQALILLNDTQFVEAARVLAATVIAQNPESEAGCTTRVFRRLMGRHPTEAEWEILLNAYGEQLAYFTENPEDAAAYVASGEYPIAEEIDAAELAALTAVAQLAMNFDEFQMKL